MKTLLTLIATFLWTTALACSCKSGGNFKMVSKHSDLVAVVQMEDYSDSVSVDGQIPDAKVPETVKFKILQVIKGSENRKQIKVFGDDGALCRPSIHQFEKGKHYVIALYRCKNLIRASGTSEGTDYYYISICGSHWIDYSAEDNVVKGVIDKKRVTTMTLDKLEFLLGKS